MSLSVCEPQHFYSSTQQTQKCHCANETNASIPSHRSMLLQGHFNVDLMWFLECNVALDSLASLRCWCWCWCWCWYWYWYSFKLNLVKGSIVVNSPQTYYYLSASENTKEHYFVYVCLVSNVCLKLRRYIIA